MLIIIPAIVFIAFLIWALFRPTKSGKDTRYSQTGNWMDFNPGEDEDKVGDPKYPNAGMDSVMKHEFLNDLMEDDK